MCLTAQAYCKTPLQKYLIWACLFGEQLEQTTQSWQLQWNLISQEHIGELRLMNGPCVGGVQL